MIHALNGTKRGQEYLDKCWVLEQTKTDRRALKEVFGKGAESGG